MAETNPRSSPLVARSFSRREVLRALLAGGAALASWTTTSATAETQLGTATTTKADTATRGEEQTGATPFVPENDYPFFGFEP